MVTFFQPINSSYPMGEGDWTNVIIPGDTGHKGFTHLRSYQVSGTKQSTENAKKGTNIK